MPKKTFAITGVTGLLGRNLFFEILKDNLKNLNDIQFIIFGRSSEKESLEMRIKQLFYGEGVRYLSEETYNYLEFDLFFFEKNITYINVDFSNENIIEKSELMKLLGVSIDSFFHIAANIDFSNSPEAVTALNTQNLEGTAQLLSACKHIAIKEFCYVSSAYVCGERYGEIQPDYTKLDQTFQNHYEKTKLQGELLVKEYQKQTGVRCRIFRPSIIVGKLIEKKKGEVNKFDVFYEWALFFLKWKMKTYNTNLTTIYDEEVEIDLKIAVNKDTGLNMVPVDFAAKVMYQVCKQNIEGDYFHLVNNKVTNYIVYLKKVLKFLNIKGYTFVNTVPENLNSMEKHYYSTVGNLFTSNYVLQKETVFNTDNLQDLYSQQKLHCPEIDDINFQILLNYAESKSFGLTV